MATQLRNLRIDRIDLVDAGASVDPITKEGAKITLFKRHEPKEEGLLAGLVDRIKDAINKTTPTFAQAANTLLAVMKAETPPVEEIGRHLSDVREYLNNQEGGDMQIDKSKLAADVVAHISELEKAASDAKAEATSAIAKAATAEAAQKKAEQELAKATATPEDVLKGLDPATRALVEKSMKEADEAKKEVAIERNTRLDKEFSEKVGVFKSLPVDAAKDGKVLREVAEKCSKETADRVMEILKAADAGMEKAGLFKEVGSSNHDGASALAQINKMAADMVAKKEATSIADAIEKVAVAQPDLYAQYQNEKNG